MTPQASWNGDFSQDKALPPQQFFWAVLDASALASGNSRITREHLGYLFESFLPLPIEQVHAAYWKHRNGSLQFVACGMQRDRLKQWIAAQPQEPTSLRPIEVPEFIVQQLGIGIDTHELNLLSEDFEPPTVTRLRRRWMNYSLVAVLILCVLSVIGLERRTLALVRQSATVHGARSNAIAQIVGLGSSSPTGNAELLMTAELRTLRQTRTQPKRSDSAETDCSAILADLLAHWPDDLHVQTESLIIAPTSITFRGVAPTSRVIQALAESLQRFDGWNVQQPQISASRDVIQATIQLKPIARSSNATGQGGAT